MQGNRVKLDNKHWYDHEPKPVKTSHDGKVTILWMQHVQSDRIIPNNKPDMHVNRHCNSYRQKFDQERSREDFKIYSPHNRNSVHVECESQSDTSNKSGDWNHSKSLRQHLSNIPGKHEIKELQKTAILGTTHILQKVLM